MEQEKQQLALEREPEKLQEKWELQEKKRLLWELEKRKKEECHHQQQEPKKLQEEQEKAKDAAAAAWVSNKCWNVKVDVQDPAGGPKNSYDNYGMDLHSDDSTDDENQPRKPTPAWASGSQLSQAIIRQYYMSPDIDQLFGTIPSQRLEDIFDKSELH
ncbi:inner centromere protein-like isoform X2 [Phascolarctos cinereus]|uniref:Inner centromere protein-like isoform X2 n=1 Tax=Phascolarctos cinereus TaxID=38626 RepID=A0A6P5JW87_PHACI|nr:inner centromere protein-like isoform X2 [Phascolarctos cinereus]